MHPPALVDDATDVQYFGGGIAVVAVARVLGGDAPCCTVNPGAEGVPAV